MNNGIVCRQNEEKSIKCLAAQRQIYNEVKKFDNVGIVFSVVLPLVLSVLQLLWKKNRYLNTAAQMLSIVSMFVGMAVNSFVTRQKKNAADIQQQFDVYVFQMPWDNKLFGKKRDLSYMIADKSKILLSKSGEESKLLNWYTPAVGTTSHIKGIWLCQKENFWWDVNLRKRFKKCSCIVIGILIALVIFIGVIQDETVNVLIERVAFIVPMLQWLFATIKQLHEDIENLKEMDELLNSQEEKSMEDLQEIQSKIYIHRKSCYAIPNFFYEKYKNNDEDVAHRTVLLEN